MLEVSLLRFNSSWQMAAPQLALLRHLYAEALKALSPQVVLFGGQRHWDDAWWTDKLREEESR